MLRCRCGARVDIRTYTKNKRFFSYYYCADAARKGRSYCDSGYVRVDKIDDMFIDYLQKIKIDPSLISLRQSKQRTVTDTKQLQDDIARLKKSIENLTAALMEHSASSAASYIVAQIEKLDSEKRQAEYALQLAEISNQEIRTARQSQETIYQQICLLLDNFDELSYRQKNELIKKTVKTCVLDGSSIDVTF